MVDRTSKKSGEMEEDNRQQQTENGTGPCKKIPVDMFAQLARLERRNDEMRRKIQAINMQNMDVDFDIYSEEEESQIDLRTDATLSSDDDDDDEEE